MENAASQQAVQDSKPPGRWARLGNTIRRMARNIFIGAILAGCVNFFLLKTGWHTCEIFTERADQFAEDIRQGSRRLSPFNLWRSITADPNENSPIHYFPEL